MSWRSHGHDNDSLVAALVRNKVIRSPGVAEALRRVDRRVCYTASLSLSLVSAARLRMLLCKRVAGEQQAGSTRRVRRLEESPDNVRELVV